VTWERGKYVLADLSEFLVVVAEVVCQFVEDVPDVFGGGSYLPRSELLHQHAEEINDPHQHGHYSVLDQLAHDKNRSLHEVFSLSLVLGICLFEHVVDDADTLLSESVILG
jgi:hypothetical protein